MKTPEGHEKHEIRSYLKTRHRLFCLSPATYGFGVSGNPDIVGCYDGRFFAVEVKRSGKSPTTLQRLRLFEIEAAGGKAFWGTAEKVIQEFEKWREALLETRF